jgi:lipopolysaccharide assembly outer membrane protein LptD (OstA)
MSSARRTPPAVPGDLTAGGFRAARRALASTGAAKSALAGGAALALLAHAAHAQPAAAPGAAAAQAPSADGLAQDELYMEADRLTRDDKQGVTTAEGAVEIRYQGRTLRADRVVYTAGAADQQGLWPRADDQRGRQRRIRRPADAR